MRIEYLYKDMILKMDANHRAQMLLFEHLKGIIANVHLDINSHLRRRLRLLLIGPFSLDTRDMRAKGVVQQPMRMLLKVRRLELGTLPLRRPEKMMGVGTDGAANDMTPLAIGVEEL